MSLHRVNRRVFVAITGCVYCAVRADCLYSNEIQFSLQQRASEFGPGPVRVKCLVDKVTMGQDFVSVLRFPLSVSFHKSSILAVALVSILSDVEAGEDRKLRLSNALRRIFFSLQLIK